MTDSAATRDWLAMAWEKNESQPVPWHNTDLLPGLQRLTPSITDSTNALLWRLRQQEYAAPLVAIAKQQQAGRGQWGRTWQSASGGLYLSLLLEAKLAPTTVSHLILLSAWGVAFALRQHRIPVQLKWPNDLLLQGQKLGGIKTETKTEANQIQAVVIGVGLNWTNPVPAVGIQLQPFCQQRSLLSLQTLGDLAEVVTAGLTLAWQRYGHQGIDAIHQDYLNWFAHRGQRIFLPEGEGRIESVSPQGELIVAIASNNGETERSEKILKYIQPGEIRLGYDALN